MTVSLYQGDCLDIMPALPASSVDLILCDLPYGTTACKWDSVIPLERLWPEYRRMCNGAFVLHAAQPFTTALIASNLEDFSYLWVWDKVQPTGHLMAKRQPLKVHEDVTVFRSRRSPYFPQMGEGKAIKRTPDKKGTIGGYKGHICNNPGKASRTQRYPKTIVTFSQGRSPDDIPLHPTQKPLALAEYLIRTYTNPGDTVLDNCMGSGTTGVACVNTGRSFIGIEKDPAYFAIAERRIQEAQMKEAIHGLSVTPVSKKRRA